MKKIMILTLSIVILIGVLAAEQTEQKNMTRPDDKGMTEQKMMPGDCMGMPGMGQGMMMDALKLSKDQKDKIERLRASHQKQMNTLQAELENLEIDLQAAIDKDNFKAAKDLNKTIFNKKLQIADARIDHMEAVLKELNADQKDTARMMFRMHRMRGGHQGMGPGMGQGMRQGMGMHKMGMNGDCDNCHGMGKDHPGMGKGGNHNGMGMQKMHNCR